MSKQTHKEPSKTKMQTSSPCAKLISLVMHFSCFLLFFFLLWNYGLTLQLPTSMPISTGSTSYGQAENTHHWPATVSMETTVSFPSWESVNSEWTWGDSYKLFPNLVISHFHAGMDIGLQVCWEWREERLPKKREREKFSWFDISLESMACCSVDRHLRLIYCEMLVRDEAYKENRS